ncbi:S-adenosyl-L-methionine-dependent tRNA 4-demethylwyosine synthase TYW1 isoform X2 [Poeciliopsis prolifica]|uniref:S-adenosyl-L-methionine-dependent tRNA 4-demethylwyosine synthase TYW1 isoform X2 n=1 Tax=Poeciliopsis prolifica TaxID=188132 RepID=UPI002412F329|nr:S-adenosyl-L-methionine-dependent tRNA 4-demethylwyosine synthase TYW1 isoform X2 [Poeciliopsis prolifica]
MLALFTVISSLTGSLSTSDTKVPQDENYLLWTWNNRLYVYSAAALLLGFCFLLQVTRRKINHTNDSGLKDSGLKAQRKSQTSSDKDADVHVSGVKIFYGSQTGTAKGFASELSQEVQTLGFPAEVIDMKDYDPDDRLADECVSKSVCVFLVATYTDGRPTENAEWFCKWLEEASTDFRYGNSFLTGLRYAVFGLGNSVYVGHYNTVGKNVDKWLWMLSARRVLSRGEGDSNVVKSRHGSVQADFRAWKVRFLSRLKALARGEKKSCSGSCKSGTSCKNRKKHGAQEEEGDEAQVELIESSSEEEGESGLSDEKTSRSLVDVEDLGNIMNNVKKAKGVKEDQGDDRMVKLSKQNGVMKTEEEEERREMITPALREALTKQGYKLIGSHSGVKLCRWTKSMLRGRGGCYKHTFYGIESHRCMETTPSLACANKCVFCWRHHTNPVGTEWRWKMDPAEKILQDSLEKHQNMIRQFRGVPGVKPERYEEGLAAKHCALSLVGEPIMYPEINTFLRLLHSRRISSFLVTNAQFPEEIRKLVPVTQLYVSVDASTRDSLKKIDRPLFKDFWPRFLDCLRALGEKQRTVYRLTLVKAWNVEELQAYAELIALGQPDFIEVKGVTYCGESSASSLTMANVPWHQEVVAFVQQLADMLPGYQVACEHEHSNCLLIAHNKFKVNGEWWTWIDYDRFQDLVQAHEDSGGQRSFSALDYTAKTPSWALFGSNEQGFDPADTRFQRRNKTKDISGC